MTGEVVRDAAVKIVLGRLREQGGVDEVVARRLYGRVEGDYERGV